MKRKRPLLTIQFIDLVLIQLSNFRWSWRSMIVVGIIVPLISVLALGTFARDSGPEALNYVLTGSVVLGLMFENLSKVSGNFAFMKAMGTLTYFATLPIRRFMLVLATVFSFFLLSLPAVLVTIFGGARILHIPLNPHPLLLLVMPLITMSLATLGALIGLSARTPEEANSLSTLLVFLLVGMGPVIMPPDRLPEWLVWSGRFSPVTYAASALRQTLLGPVTSQIMIDLGVLLIVALVIGRWVAHKMAWRQE